MSINSKYSNFYKMANSIYGEEKFTSKLLSLAEEANNDGKDELELLLIGICFISKYNKPLLEALEKLYPIVGTVMVLELYTLLRMGLIKKEDFKGFLLGMFSPEDADEIISKLNELSNPFSDN